MLCTPKRGGGLSERKECVAEIDLSSETVEPGDEVEIAISVTDPFTGEAVTAANISFSEANR